MIVAELLASFVEYICILWVLGAFFQKKNTNWYTIATILLGGVLHVCLSASNGSMIIRLILLLTDGLWVCAACFHGKIVKKFLILLAFWAVAFAVDISVLSGFTAILNHSIQAILDPDGGYLWAMLSSRSLLLSISFGCGHIIHRQERRSGGIIWVYLLLIPLYTIMGVGTIINDAMQSGVLSIGVFILSGGLLCINVILFLVINKLEESRLTTENEQRLQTEAIHNLELAKTYQESFNQQRKITHDFQNQLDTINNLLGQGDYDRAADYVGYLLRTDQKISPLINTNHPMIDAILNQKYRQAYQQGISMLLYCNDLSAIPLEDGDLVTLLGNLLDNAIAASAQSTKKLIWMRLWQEQGVYQLVVRNSCLPAMVERDRKNQPLHGFGNELIRTVLKKYDYPYYVEQTDGQYVFSAILQ